MYLSSVRRSPTERNRITADTGAANEPTMTFRPLALIVRLSCERPLLAWAGILLALGSGVCARMAQAQEPWPVTRTSDGQPDLQGVWDFRTMTPLERPEAVRDKAVLSEEDRYPHISQGSRLRFSVSSQRRGEHERGSGLDGDRHLINPRPPACNFLGTDRCQFGPPLLFFR